jgi:ADP-ribosylglycohydrolase
MIQTTAEKFRKSKLIQVIMISMFCPNAALTASIEENPATAIGSKPGVVHLSKAEYAERVYASWLGQIVGNIYGLSYEFQFIDEPGPDEFPYGFGASLERVRKVNGAFSDDDTDVEYMYLLQMEKHGIEPTYENLANAWKYHVRDKVWVANRSALTLMHAGYSPPVTGNRNYNPNWFQIDPQLVNEIWAVTAPGMLDYATRKSAWAAKITNDDFGIEPTVHYAAMYSAAFFEKDIERLIDIGTAALPEGSRFAATVEHMKRLYREYPEDWQKARKVMSATYYGEFDYNKGAWAAVDANLNGAAGILALLYGQGDFQRTLDFASGMGFDADNQAATMSGLLGIIHGTEGIPKVLLYPLGLDKWQLPFNDVYRNVSRYDLPDASIRDLAARTAEQGALIILANGGKMVRVDGVDYYEIDKSAKFTAPFELVTAPALLAEIGRNFSFQYYFGVDADSAAYTLTSGSLPAGLILDRNRIHGAPSETGEFGFRVQVSSGDAVRHGDYTIRVHGENLAMSAQKILFNGLEGIEATLDGKLVEPANIEIIRDGGRRGQTYYNRAPDGEPRVNYYGYAWNEPQTVSTIVFNPGLPEEWGGWFTTLEVQYKDEAGDWQNAELLSIEPGLNFDNTQWLKGAYIDHSLSIEPVLTTALRIIGDAGGIDQDARNGGERRYYTAISELAVYAD